MPRKSKDTQPDFTLTDRTGHEVRFKRRLGKAKKLEAIKKLLAENPGYCAVAYCDAGADDADTIFYVLINNELFRVDDTRNYDLKIVDKLVDSCSYSCDLFSNQSYFSNYMEILPIPEEIKSKVGSFSRDMIGMFGEYPIKVSNASVVVECQSVPFDVFDKIVEAYLKIRNNE